MSKIVRRAFILNFLILLIGLFSYSQLTQSLFEKEFFYLAGILFLSTCIITFLIYKTIITPVTFDLNNTKKEFEILFERDMPNFATPTLADIA